LKSKFSIADLRCEAFGVSPQLLHGGQPLFHRP
jgi:hypothetical protein